MWIHNVITKLLSQTFSGDDEMSDAPLSSTAVRPSELCPEEVESFRWHVTQTEIHLPGNQNRDRSRTPLFVSSPTPPQTVWGGPPLGGVGVYFASGRFRCTALLFGGSKWPQKHDFWTILGGGEGGSPLNRQKTLFYLTKRAKLEGIYPPPSPTPPLKSSKIDDFWPQKWHFWPLKMMILEGGVEGGMGGVQSIDF